MVSMLFFFVTSLPSPIENDDHTLLVDHTFSDNYYGHYVSHLTPFPYWKCWSHL